MKRFLLVIILFLNFNLKAQEYSFAWLSDTHIGAPGARVYLDSIVQKINKADTLRFVVVSGDLTEKGRNDEFVKFKEIMDKLTIPYYVIPGNHDFVWSESGGLKFSELWEENNFNFKYGNEKYIGLNAAILWRAGGGHFSPEVLNWAKNILQQTNSDSNIILFVHFPLTESIDNWFKLTNLLSGKKIKAILVGHYHKYKKFNFNGIPGFSNRSTLKEEKNSWGFTIVNVSQQRLNFFECDSTDSLKFLNSIPLDSNLFIPKIDSNKIINYASKILWTKDLNSTTIASPLVLKDKIIIANYNGLITCFDLKGKELWNFQAFGNIVSTPAAKDGYIIVATLQGDLITLEESTGEEIQSIGFDETITSGLLTIDYTGSKELMVPKKTNSKAAVIFGTASGRLYCYDVETLQQYWLNKDARGMIQTTPLYVNNKIIYSAWDTFFYCIDAREGWLIWRWRMNNNFYYSPAATHPVTDGKFIYITEPNKFVYKIDLLLGKTIWATDEYNAWESIGISQNYSRLFIKSQKDNFYIVPAKNGKGALEFRINFGNDFNPTTPIEYSKKIFFITQNGYVYQINGKKYKKIIFLGNARPFSLKRIKDNIFLSTNIDGRILLFEPKTKSSASRKFK